MREFKFRAWDGEKIISQSKNKEYDDYYMLTLQGDFYAHTRTGDEYFDFYDDELNKKPYILMQFTGFKDKAGNDIYEGDILNNGAPTQNVAVKFERGAFWCYADELLGYEAEVKYDIDTDPYIFFHDCEPSKWATVVGNIYEHTHLINKPSDYNKKEAM